MDKSNQEKIFKLMCSDCWQVGVELFKANDLDFDEFVDYALHRAGWFAYDNLTYIKNEIRSLNRSFVIYCRPSIKQMSYRGLINGEVYLKFYGRKLSRIPQFLVFDYPLELSNELYEDYMADKIYNEFKTNLKIEFDKLI